MTWRLGLWSGLKSLGLVKIEHPCLRTSYRDCSRFDFILELLFMKSPLVVDAPDGSDQ